MRKILSLLILINSLCISAQTWAWSRKSNGIYTHEGRSVSSDANGNAFVTGYYNQNFGIGTYSYSYSGGRDIMLAKYNKNGTPVWARSFGGNGQDFGFSVFADSTGTIFLTGAYSSTAINFGSNFLGSPSGYSQIFVTKMDSFGNTIWARSTSGPTQGAGNSVTKDIFGNVCVAGYFSSPTMIINTTTLTSAGSFESFLSMYDKNGNLKWARSGGGPSSEIAWSSCTDRSGNTYISGNFSSSSAVFGAYTLTKPGPVSTGALFLVKYDTTGNVIWAKTENGSASGNGICSDANGNIYMTGIFLSSTLVIGTFTLNQTTNSEMFVAKYDSTGSVLWAKSINGTGDESGTSISAYNNNVFVGGRIMNSTTFTAGVTSYTVPPGSNNASFIGQYDSNGNFICGALLKEGGADQFGVNADNFGNALVCSDFGSSPYVVGSDTLLLTPSANSNLFVGKFNCLDVGIDEQIMEYISTLYPNPNNGTFTILIGRQIEKGEIIIFNSLGQKIHEQKIQEGLSEIILGECSDGLYHYILTENKIQIQNGKIVVSH